MARSLPGVNAHSSADFLGAGPHFPPALAPWKTSWFWLFLDIDLGHCYKWFKKSGVWMLLWRTAPCWSIPNPGALGAAPALLPQLNLGPEMLIFSLNLTYAWKSPACPQTENCTWQLWLLAGLGSEWTLCADPNGSWIVPKYLVFNHNRDRGSVEGGNSAPYLEKSPSKNVPWLDKNGSLTED